jgi:hypothetical protein
LEDEEFETICRWAEGLQSDPRVEVRAAAKAILMLAAELERLQVELWNTRLALQEGRVQEEGPEREAAEVPSAELEPDLKGQVRSLVSRAGRTVRRLPGDRFFHRDQR